MSIGLSQPQYSAYEHEAIPPLDRLQALAQLYDLPLKHFTDLLHASHKVGLSQNGAEKSAISDHLLPLGNGSPKLSTPPSDLHEHLKHLKERFDLLSRDLNDFLRRWGAE